MATLPSNVKSTSTTPSTTDVVVSSSLVISPSITTVTSSVKMMVSHSESQSSSQLSRRNTRSASGAAVNSTYMKIHVSPDKSPDKSFSCDSIPTASTTVGTTSPVSKTTDSDSILKDDMLNTQVLLDLIRANDLKIDLLSRELSLSKGKIDKLEKDVEVVHSLLKVKDCVIDGVKGELSRLEQYTRRYSVVISGVDKTDRRESIEVLRPKVEDIVNKVTSTTTVADIDKLHRNGPVKGTRQDIILRFKSHSAKEEFYKARKTLPLELKHIRIKPSLSPSQQALLDESRDLLDEYHHGGYVGENPPDYVFANVHGVVQVKMKNKSKDGQFITIQNISHLCQVLAKSSMNKKSLEAYDGSKGFDDHSDSSDEDDMGFNRFD